MSINDLSVKAYLPVVVPYTTATVQAAGANVKGFFGGTQSFTEAGKWPMCSKCNLPMTHFLHALHPVENVYYTLHMCINDDKHTMPIAHLMKTEQTQARIITVMPISEQFAATYTAQLITGYTPVDEWLSATEIMGLIEELESDEYIPLLRQLLGMAVTEAELAVIPEDDFLGWLTTNFKRKFGDRRPNRGIKFGGVPYSREFADDSSAYSNFLQIGLTPYCTYAYGDGGCVHIDTKGAVEGDY